MRKLVLSLAAAAAALVIASPAAAQYYPQPQAYGGYGYNGYGNNNYGQVRALQARIDAVQYRISQFGRYGGRGHTERLREESRSIERQLHQAARGGLNPYEMNQIQVRIAQLEQRIQYGMGNRNGGYGRYDQNGGYGHYGDRGGNWSHDGERDRDHDGDDRDDDD
jgi:hypothetical protein